jgi:hypothetical protein
MTEIQYYYASTYTRAIETFLEMDTQALNSRRGFDDDAVPYNEPDDIVLDTHHAELYQRPVELTQA